jgi:hypothetical protein
LERALERVRKSDALAPEERFRIRIATVGCIAGIALSLASAAELAIGFRPLPVVELASLGGFAAGLTAVLVAIRRGVGAKPLLGPALFLVTAFLFTMSAHTSRMHPEQLPWFVVIPTIAHAMDDDGAERRGSLLAATCMALLGAGAVYVFHAAHLGPSVEPVPISPLVPIVDEVFLGVAVVTQLALAEHLRRRMRAELDALRELLCVCAWCRKIRAADGRWQSSGEYVARRSERPVARSVCPTCAAKA